MRSCIYLFSIVILFTSACREKPEFSNFAGTAQGTTYSIVFENSPKLDPFALKAEIEKILDDFDMSLSLYKDSSILSRINRNEDVMPDEYFIEVFRRSVEISYLTKGAFDITVGPLVRAWGFGPDEHKDVSAQKVDSLLRLVGIDKLKLTDGKIVKSDPRVKLDFNAIAQGYSVDVLSNYLLEKGIKNSLVEIGGEVRARGSKNGNPWRIGIDRPEDNNMIPGQNLSAVMEMEDRSLATSGNYRKFYVENGIKYSHTINPFSGYPAKNRLLSATILASDCATADGIATACMVMGKEKSIEFLDLHPEYDAYLIYSDEEGNFKTWMSENLKGLVFEE